MGTVRLTMIMIYFTKVNTRSGGHARHAVGHFAFALAMSIMIMINLTVPCSGFWPGVARVGPLLSGRQ